MLKIHLQGGKSITIPGRPLASIVGARIAAALEAGKSVTSVEAPEGRLEFEDDHHADAAASLLCDSDRTDVHPMFVAAVLNWKYGPLKSAAITASQARGWRR